MKKEEKIEKIKCELVDYLYKVYLINCLEYKSKFGSLVIDAISEEVIGGYEENVIEKIYGLFPGVEETEIDSLFDFVYCLPKYKGKEDLGEMNKFLERVFIAIEGCVDGIVGVLEMYD